MFVASSRVFFFYMYSCGVIPSLVRPRLPCSSKPLRRGLPSWRPMLSRGRRRWESRSSSTQGTPSGCRCVWFSMHVACFPWWRALRWGQHVNLLRPRLPYTAVYNFKPPWGDFPRSIARQPRWCQRRTYVFGKLSARCFRCWLFFWHRTIFQLCRDARIDHGKLALGGVIYTVLYGVEVPADVKGRAGMGSGVGSHGEGTGRVHFDKE